MLFRSGSLRSVGRHKLRRLVQRGVDLAHREGCSVVGLGGYCSIVTRNGKKLAPHGMALTTGNGFTAAAGLEAMRAAALESGIEWETARAAVVGATGNIGSVFADLLAQGVDSVVLIARPHRIDDAKRLAARAVVIFCSSFLFGWILAAGHFVPEYVAGPTIFLSAIIAFASWSAGMVWGGPATRADKLTFLFAGSAILLLLCLAVTGVLDE